MEFYHLLNRGVDKRDIFLDDSDRFRFIHDLFEFNDIALADNNLSRNLACVLFDG
jgi:putative transposase